jgi:hypothetical protein
LVATKDLRRRLSKLDSSRTIVKVSSCADGL